MEILEFLGFPIKIGMGGFSGAVGVYKFLALKVRKIYTPQARGAVFAPGTVLRDGGGFLRSQRASGVYIWNPWWLVDGGRAEAHIL